LLAVEYCWNVYPSTPFSSTVLHVSHAAIATALWLGGDWASSSAAASAVAVNGGKKKRS